MAGQPAVDEQMDENQCLAGSRTRALRNPPGAIAGDLSGFPGHRLTQTASGGALLFTNRLNNRMQIFVIQLLISIRIGLFTRFFLHLSIYV